MSSKATGAAQETIIGGGGDDSLMAGSGNDYIQGNITQVVYLDFPTSSQTSPGDHIYTAAEENAVLNGLQQDYAAFNYAFTLDPTAAQTMSQISGGRYATILFNAGIAGGSSSELDPGNLDLGGVSIVNVNPFLGDPTAGLVMPTSANIVGLTTTIAAHELGHLSGLQHQDAFGPIGTGIAPTVNPNEFSPSYTGPTAATETSFDIMASPASVGTTLAEAAGPTWIGERDAIKLAFNDSGTVLQEPNLTPQTVSGVSVMLPQAAGGRAFAITSAYSLGSLPTLAVPNTLGVGARDYGQTFNVTATAVNGTLATPSQEDFYAINGKAGQVMTFQVISNNDTLNPSPILPELLLVGPTGNVNVPWQVLGYNRQEFESPDSTLLDVTLPSDGTYYVGVDSYHSLTSGNYQLFMYSFATGAGSTLGGGDTIIGGSGNDTLVGSSANDQFVFPANSSGNATLLGGSGQDVLDLSNAPSEKVTATGNIKILGPTASVTTTTVSSSSSTTSPVFGQAVTFTATVAADTRRNADGQRGLHGPDDRAGSRLGVTDTERHTRSGQRDNEHPDRRLA